MRFRDVHVEHRLVDPLVAIQVCSRHGFTSNSAVCVPKLCLRMCQ
jgi:hypothetical protein